MLPSAWCRSLAGSAVSGPGQSGDLCAGIVDIEFACDVEAGLGEQRGERITDDGAAAMADMDWAGGIGRDVFHVDLGAGTNRAIAEGLASAEDDRERAA